MSTRTPVITPCPHCRIDVLEARWDDQDGMPPIGTARLDPVALDHQQRVACIITGVRLWQLQDSPLGLRTSLHTRWWPARPVNGHVLPAPRCGTTWDAFPVDLKPLTITYPDDPPF